jgi:hypothetical protein
VDEIQIQVFESQLVHRNIKGLQRRLVAVLGVPQFRGNEQFFALDAAQANALAHALLVSIDGGGVDMAVTRVNGRLTEETATSPSGVCHVPKPIKES